MSFAKAVSFTFRWEGGLTKDARDPGGTTKYGISQRAYPKLDIPEITKEQAAQIYYDDYWVPAGCEDIKDPALAMSVFDAAVNCGVSRVKKWLKEDFRDGVTTEEFNSRREVYYRREVKESLRNVYLRGWLRRLDDLRKTVAGL